MRSSLILYQMKSALTVKVNYIIDSIQFKFICIAHFTIQNRCKAALQEIRFLQYILLVAYQWWLCQVDVHMAEMYSKNQLMT